ncbi:MAG TPA: dTDP-4-dehydrorhamnose 3,5-epimerase family protein, partial [Candidatus Eisenbacteria bacterium]
MIDGVILKPLKVIPDERGFLMEILRKDDPFFKEFGQVYLTVVYPDVVKGWHYHRKQTDHFCVVKGMSKVVLYDSREGSRTFGEVNEFFLGDHNRTLLVIPPLVLHGMKGVGTEPA